MKKVLVLMLVMVMLVVASTVLAGGGKVRGENSQGPAERYHENGNLWWDD